MTEKVSKPLKVGVYIPGDLAERLLKIMEDTGLSSISKLVQEAIRLFIAEHSWKIGGEVVGVVGVLYDHEVDRVDDKLTDIQHKFLSTIISAVHIHLDERLCLLVIAVRGPSNIVKELVSNIEGVKGVKLVRSMLLPKQ
jgi:CopG family nickel-responsive transcriptional regulator